jgi:hypothetical protein
VTPTSNHLQQLHGQDRITAAALNVSRVLCFAAAAPVPLAFALYALVQSVRDFYGSSFGPQPFKSCEGHPCDRCPRKTA